MADDVEKNIHKLADVESPGARLKRARKAKNLTTRKIASDLHMDSWMLDAIERDEFSALGAPVFAKGHLRKYATTLGIDPNELMVAYYQICGPRETPPLIAESILRVEAENHPRFGWLLPAAIVFAAVGSVAVGALWYLRSDAAPRPASAPSARHTDVEMEARRSTLLALPIATASVPPDETTAVPPPADTLRTPLPPLQMAAMEASTTEVANTEPAMPLGSVTLTLRFRTQSWVEVYDRDRNKLLYGMGEADTVQYLSGPPPLHVFLGRYRGVDVEVNGNNYSIPPEVRRTNTARFRIEDPKSL